jgi:hypothetical protein
VPVQVESAKHAVFLGLYQAERFKDRISGWLAELDLSDAHLFVVDNNSGASPESWIVPILVEKSAEFTFVRNEQNYGGYGSLIKNLSLFEKYGWVTTLHQDDLYSSEHVQVHMKISKDAGPRLGMVCTEPVSETFDGKEIALPRGNWFLNSTDDSVEFFLAHLRNHIFPFSGATFRTAVLKNYHVPWHSTAFPDTELVMKMAPDYSVVFAPGTTVRYFENPYSESHSLSASQRDFGVFQALIRVFTHESYGKICNLVEESERERFLESLVTGIDVRFRDKDLAAVFRQTALELTGTHFGVYGTLAKLLTEGYRKVGDSAAVSALAGLSGSQNESGQRGGIDVRGAEITKVKIHYKLASALLSFIPRRFRAPLAKAIMKTSIGKKVFPQWNLSWKR